MNNQLRDIFILLLLILAALANCVKAEEDEAVVTRNNNNNKSAEKNDGRFIIQGSDYTINFLPFFILIKIAFILGK